MIAQHTAHHTALFIYCSAYLELVSHSDEEVMLSPQNIMQNKNSKKLKMSKSFLLIRS